MTLFFVRFIRCFGDASTQTPRPPSHDAGEECETSGTDLNGLQDLSAVVAPVGIRPDKRKCPSSNVACQIKYPFRCRRGEHADRGGSINSGMYCVGPFRIEGI